MGNSEHQNDDTRPDSDRAESIFFAARDLPGAERAAFLESQCAGDPALLREIEGLLAHDHASFLDSLAGLRGEGKFDDLPHPERVGRYQIRRVLGEGGMGTVFLGEQTEPVRLEVAIKFIRRGSDDAATRARLVAEREVLASMDHPGIAKILDAGSTDDGRPYFVMEYVGGRTITEWADDRALSIGERLTLFLQVCDAVYYAHQHGIIHRDLKPSNILVVASEDRPIVKIIDFGLAKPVDRDASQPGLTQVGHAVGTLGYMSPEQATGGPDSSVDTRADVYSLGLVLYQLLTGYLPFEPDELYRMGRLDLLRFIGEAELPRASQRLLELGESADAAAQSRGMSSCEGLRRRVRGDLNWILESALAKDRRKRYPGVHEFAADIRRHLANEPVLARPSSARYVLLKFVRRHRGAVAAALTIFVLLVAGAVGIGTEYARAESNLRAFDLLARGDDLDALEAAMVEARWPTRRESVAPLARWVADASALVAGLGDMGEYAALLRSEFGTLDDREEWQFEHGRYRALDEFLTQFLPRLRAFAAPAAMLDRARVRLDWAQRVEDATTTAYAEEWDVAIARIAASPHYGGLAIERQVGLVPLDADPQSGLHEFAFLVPGMEVPARADDRRLVIAERSCPVLVLIPGAAFDMGDDDPDHTVSQPVHRVVLDPYLIGKYELSQAQWLALTGVNPSRYKVPDHAPFQALSISPIHPVESVDWTTADRELARWGLWLPTEAQWEYAARGGLPTSVWFEGVNVPMERVGNVGDQSALAVVDAINIVPAAGDWTDGYAVHAPIDAFDPNPFGLFGVVGNLWEWCRDDYCLYSEGTARPGDGFREWDDQLQRRPLRGGSWCSGLARCLSAARIGNPPTSALPVFGVRVARPLD